MSAPLAPCAGPPAASETARATATSTETVVATPAPRRPLGERHPGALTALLVVVALLEGWSGMTVGTTGSSSDQVARAWIAVSVVAALALVVRHRWPWAALAVTVAAAMTTAATGHQLVVFSILVLVYRLAVDRTVARVVVVAGSVVCLLGLALLAGPVMFFGGRLGLYLLALAFVVLLGVSTGNRRRYLAAVLERAAQLERDRHREAALAAAAERARIARELHDVVAHSLSVVVRLSDGASAVLVDDPQRAARAVEHIGAVSRQSLADMRRLLGVLRTDDDPELAPAPGLGDLDELVATFRTAGLPVSLARTTDGTVGPAVELVAYRAVQEGLTNALRYAESPRSVLARVTVQDEDLEVEVVDDGQESSRGRGAGPAGSGYGLTGLRERVALVGGSLEVGPRSPGPGWRLRLVVPRQAAHP